MSAMPPSASKSEMRVAIRALIETRIGDTFPGESLFVQYATFVTFCRGIEENFLGNRRLSDLDATLTSQIWGDLEQLGWTDRGAT